MQRSLTAILASFALTTKCFTSYYCVERVMIWKQTVANWETTLQAGIVDTFRVLPDLYLRSSWAITILHLNWWCHAWSAPATKNVNDVKHCRWLWCHETSSWLAKSGRKKHLTEEVVEIHSKLSLRNKHRYTHTQRYAWVRYNKWWSSS